LVFGAAGAFVVVAFDADLASLAAADLMLDMDFGAGAAADDFEAVIVGLAAALSGVAAGFAAGFLLLASFFAAFTFAGFVVGALVAFATGFLPRCL
jgi:hypothetical protein